MKQSANLALNNHAVAPSEQAGAALRTFFRIATAWRLSHANAETLLGVSHPTYMRWRANPNNARLGPNTLERLSYLFGIYKNLQVLLPDPEAADQWVHRPNSALLFQGQTPMQRMLGGQVADLYQVRRHLDAARGLWS